MFPDHAAVLVPPLVYGAISWLLRPSAVLAVFAAPFAWAAFAFLVLMTYFGPGGTLPQVPLILAAMGAAVVGFCAFIAALFLLSFARHLATVIAGANCVAWVLGFVIAIVF